MRWSHCIRVFVIERDIYARQSIVGYLSWDRRTRVVGAAGDPREMIAVLGERPKAARLDAVTLDVGSASQAAELRGLIESIRHDLPQTAIICLSSSADAEGAVAASQAGARAYLVRESVGPGIAGAVHFALQHSFVITHDIQTALRIRSMGSLAEAAVLPSLRRYDRLTPRIEQALRLCVLEGLPAELAAEEMGVSTSTVRSYIKEGYRILESQDDMAYPPTISPAERAFLRITALDMKDRPPQIPPRQRAA